MPGSPKDIQPMISAEKNETFMEKKDIFNIYAQNIDCVYTLEPPRQIPGPSHQENMSVKFIPP